MKTAVFYLCGYYRRAVGCLKRFLVAIFRSPASESAAVRIYVCFSRPRLAWTTSSAMETRAVLWACGSGAFGCAHPWAEQGTAATRALGKWVLCVHGGSSQGSALTWEGCVTCSPGVGAWEDGSGKHLLCPSPSAGKNCDLSLILVISFLP